MTMGMKIELKALEQFSEKGDLVILISSSGESKNMTSASRFTKNKKLRR